MVSLVKSHENTYVITYRIKILSGIANIKHFENVNDDYIPK